MSGQFSSDDGRQYEQITNMWDEILVNSPRDKRDEAKKQIQILISAAIARCVAQITGAFETIGKYSKSSPHLFFSTSEAEKNTQIAAQKEIIKTSLIPLIHFTEYAKKDKSFANDRTRKQYQFILSRVANEMPELMDNTPRDTDNRKP